MSDFANSGAVSHIGRYTESEQTLGVKKQVNQYLEESESQ
jgi:hypothetical protein